MAKWGSFVLEMIRLVILLVLSLLVLGGVERAVYEAVFGHPVYHWTMTAGNLLLFLVLYRNYLQFKGWFKSENNKKLNKATTRGLVTVSAVLLLLPIWL